VTESPSALLERAAAALECLAADATVGPWQARELPDEPGYANVLVDSAQAFGGFSSLFSSSCCGGHCFGHVERGGDANWIAALSPAVASPLVEWLRESARMWNYQDQPGPDVNALAFACVVLGETMPNRL
jgi:hypothetical protein